MFKMGRAKICGRREVKTGLKGIDMLRDIKMVSESIIPRPFHYLFFLSILFYFYFLQIDRRTRLKVCVSKRKSYNKIYLSLMSEAVEGTRKTLKETEGQSI